MDEAAIRGSMDVKHPTSSKVNTFLKFHDALRKSDRFSNNTNNNNNNMDPQGSEDYQLYISAIAGHPSAIETIFYYCIRTDDVQLMLQLFHHVGTSYLFKHFSYIHDESYRETAPSHVLGELKPVFYLVALFGSHRIFHLLAHARLTVLMETALLLSQHQQQLQQQPQQLSSLSEEEFNTLKASCLPSLCIMLNQSTIRYKSTPILVAAAKNHSSIVAQLLQYGVDPNTTDEHGSTPAILAAAFNHIPILQELAKYNTTFWNQTNCHGMTPGLVATHRGHLDVLLFLSSPSSSSSSSVTTTTTTATTSSSMSRVDFRIFNSSGLGSIHLAAIYNHAHLIPFFLHSTITTTTSTATSPTATTSNSTTSSSNNNNSNSNSTSSNNPPRQALVDVHATVALTNPMLIVPISNNNNNGSTNVTILQQDTAFLISARNNHYNIIRAFLKASPLSSSSSSQYHSYPNKATFLTTRDIHGMTALHIAAKYNYPPVIQEIIDGSTTLSKHILKSILDSEDTSGKTPLYYASLKGFLNIVTLLAPLSDCSYTCRISDSDVRVQPPILAASANGHADIVDLLIQHGALVDQTDSHGHTAVSVAAKLGHLSVVKTLVKHGADLTIRSINQGGTPLQKAKKYKQDHVVEFLNEVFYEERRSNSVQSRQDAQSLSKGWITGS